MQKEALLEHLKAKGFNQEIIDGFEKVNRQEFVPEHVKNYAYEDISLPLGEGSKISKPSEIAFILEHLELKKGQKILEIGSGSGYVLALMASIIKEGEIYGLEINESLAIKAKQRLDNLPWVHIVRRDGYRGLPEYEPFDRILISAFAQDITSIYNILDQLKEDGIMLAPIKENLIYFKKSKGKIDKKEFKGFNFVPLIKTD
ncbi:protein-L-isoaspartate O-methyltransferase [Candidatus Pacearchaeota archaeon]|nr:protein-L-isoaspartate O-methyltransferase [Candidatus Pacearchaeota archaeon]